MEYKLRKPKVTQINDHIWLLNDNNEATGYVVAGNKSALVIDTMIGLVDVKSEASKLTDLPLTLINTHGHGDHIGGNWSFDKAYMNLADLEVAKESLEWEEVKEAVKTLNITYPEFYPIEDEQIFDLGGLSLQAYYMPGHTPGEIVLIDRADRILFSGDGVLEQLWMQLPQSLSIDTLIKSMERLKFLRPEFDIILSGHSTNNGYPATLYDDLLAGAIELRDKNCANDEPYEWFGGECMAHPYGPGVRKIVYNEA